MRKERNYIAMCDNGHDFFTQSIEANTVTIVKAIEKIYTKPHEKRGCDNGTNTEKRSIDYLIRYIYPYII